MGTVDLNVVSGIPGFKVVMKAVLRSQIQYLVEQLAETTGEESILLIASADDGTFSHLGSEKAKLFVDNYQEVKSQFLSFCHGKGHQRPSTGDKNHRKVKNAVKLDVDGNLRPTRTNVTLDDENQTPVETNTKFDDVNQRPVNTNVRFGEVGQIPVPAGDENNKGPELGDINNIPEFPLLKRVTRKPLFSPKRSRMNALAVTGETELIGPSHDIINSMFKAGELNGQSGTLKSSASENLYPTASKPPVPKDSESSTSNISNHQMDLNKEVNSWEGVKGDLASVRGVSGGKCVRKDGKESDEDDPEWTPTELEEKPKVYGPRGKPRKSTSQIETEYFMSCQANSSITYSLKAKTTKKPSIELDEVREIPGFRVIMKAVLRSQIQYLVEQVFDIVGEESLVLTASIDDGTFSHLGSENAKFFIEDYEDVKSQFLGFCLKSHHLKQYPEDRRQLQTSVRRDNGPKVEDMYTSPNLKRGAKNPLFSAKRPRISGSGSNKDETELSGADSDAVKFEVGDESGITGSVTRSASKKLDVGSRKSGKDSESSCSNASNYQIESNTGEMNLEGMKVDFSSASGLSGGLSSGADKAVSGGSDLGLVAEAAMMKLLWSQGEKATHESQSTGKHRPGQDADGVVEGPVPRVNTKQQLELNIIGETNLEGMKEDSFSDVSNDELEFITIGETNLEGMQVDSGSVSGLHVPSSDAHMIVPSNSDLGVVASGSALEDDRLSMDGRAMDLDDPEWTPTGLKQETKGPGQDGNLMSQTEEVDCAAEVEKGEDGPSSGNFLCSLCGKSFQGHSSLRRHMAIHNQPSGLRCESCDLQFLEAYDLKIHNKFKHNKDKLECGICDKRFTSRSGKNSHMKMHFDEILHKCRVCGRGFSCNSRLVRHMTRHSEKFDYKCRLCGHSYKHKSSLDRHTCKIGVARHICSVCGQILDSKDALKNHLRMHVPEGQFSCSKCDKVFRWPSSLKNHEQKCGHYELENDGNK